MTDIRDTISLNRYMNGSDEPLAVYKHCTAHGLAVHKGTAETGCDYVLWSSISELPKGLLRYVMAGLYRRTASTLGPYPSDVEKLLRGYSEPVEQKGPHGTDA